MTEFKASRFVRDSLRHHIIKTVLLAVAVLGLTVAGILPSLVLEHLIDDAILPAIDAGSLSRSGLWQWTLLYYGSYLLLGVLTLMELTMIDALGQRLIHELRYIMMEKSHHLKSGYYRHTGTGVMQSRVMDDVEAIESLFTDGLLSVAVSLLKILAILVSVFVFSWVLGLIVLSAVPIIFFVAYYFRKQLLQHQLKRRKVRNRETNNLSESIDNITTLRNLEKRGYREEAFESLLNQDRHIGRQTAVYDALFSPIVMSLRALIIALVTLLVAYSLRSGNTINGLSVGTFAASLSLISNIFSPIQDLGQEIQTMQEGNSGIKRVEEFMALPEDDPTDESITAEGLMPEGKPVTITFDHLSFHYDDGMDAIFDEASFEIHYQEKVTLIGRTGAGKTTLFRLLLGLLKPTGGSILINGVDVGRIPNPQKRHIFGYVEQGFKPVPGTVRDQITLGDATISEEDIESAMKSVFLDSYVKEHLAQGYDTPFASESFSRGQLQLLSLARALVSKPKILLLDEISANLDSQTESDILEAIEKATADRTVISISHRLSDRLGFDRTIEIRDGKAVESN